MENKCLLIIYDKFVVIRVKEKTFMGNVSKIFLSGNS